MKRAGTSETSVAVYQITPSHIPYERKLEQRIFFEIQKKISNQNKELFGAQ
jgi:hypothetical protein